MKKIILITGGQRSGKSTKAEQLALSLSSNPVYLATAHVWDDEFRLRVQKHQERRGPEWTNIEEEIHLSKHDLSGRVVVIDCVTLWLTNLISIEHETSLAVPSDQAERDILGEAKRPLGDDRRRLPEQESRAEHYLAQAKAEFDAFTAPDATYIFVTNEIGSGGVSTNALQRRFTDLQGWMNQYIAQKADEVILMVSGIPVKIK
jgi:adenosylcobinamide kinase/adenosylcobinamide-phosphate guanylyltransferase